MKSKHYITSHIDLCNRGLWKNALCDKYEMIRATSDNNESYYTYLEGGDEVVT